MREVHRIEYHSNVSKLLMFIIYSIKRFVPCCCLTPVDLTLSHSGLLHRHLVIPRKQPWKIWLNCHMDWHFRVNISRFSQRLTPFIIQTHTLSHIILEIFEKGVMNHWLYSHSMVTTNDACDTYPHTRWLIRPQVSLLYKTCQLDLNGRAD